MLLAENSTYTPNLDQLDDRIYHLDEMIWQLDCIHETLEEMCKHLFKFKDHLKELKGVIHASK
jgi:hypothetical protein